MEEMEILIGIFVVIFGIVFGSFYNVVIYRLPADESIAKGRSFCPNCKTSLKAWDLIPVFSQLFLRNKCRYCKEKISIQYPLIELLTGALFFFGYYLYGFNIIFGLHILLWSMLLITMMIDFKHMIVFDSVLLFFAVPGAVCRMIEGEIIVALLGMLAGFGAYLLIYLIAKLIYGQEAFGFGDVLLMGTIGIYLGVRDALLVAIGSFLVAAVAIIIMAIFRKKITKKMEIPFGPYICIAAFIISIWSDQIVAAYWNFNILTLFG